MGGGLLDKPAGTGERWPADEGASGGPVAGGEHPQQRVQPVTDSTGLHDELVAGVDQQLEVSVQGRRGELGQAEFLASDPRDGDGVDLVVLAARAAAPSTLGGQRRRDVHDALAGTQQHPSEGQPVATGALHRHQPRRGERADPTRKAPQFL
jgi:hypothetical protein